MVFKKLERNEKPSIWEAPYLTGEDLKVVWAEFSTLR
jgi:hypothetical protein